MSKTLVSGLLVAAATCALAACGGGGGGGGLASTPTPTPTATPTSSAVNIFPSPASQEFATIGIGADMRIRYDAATKKYEVMAGSLGWTELVDDPHSTPLPGRPNQMFAFAGAPDNQSVFVISTHYSFDDPTVSYQYSNLAHWAHSPANVGGTTAFGMATPASGVPVTGSATYQGMIDGFATDTYFDQLAGADVLGSVGGSINLAFNFGSGNLSGSISPTLQLGTSHPLGTLNFIDTLYSTGSTSFSGRFNTTIAGANSFAGLFTGPHAQELIGKFAFPYLSPIDGTAKQAGGAFIGKQ